ncbi:guanine nucleotide binding protein, alpha subunit [Mycena polygramma]|nr:guanine nucleotide binding protein, alpha subunit [Mycena polygramma]
MRSLDIDPISAALAPPENESPQERQSRVMKEGGEGAAKQVSDNIDNQLHRERQQMREQSKPVKILLLGANAFLMNYAALITEYHCLIPRQAFRAERASWRTIIQLNVIRSLRIILDALDAQQNDTDIPLSPHAGSSPAISFDFDLVRTRLLPVLTIEGMLRHRLGSPDIDGQSEELAVKSTLARKRKSALMRDAGRDSFDTQNVADWDLVDPGPILYARREDMQRLWTDPGVREILTRQGIRLQQSPGLFMELEDVTSLQYIPTDDHVLRVRLKTLGVSEHRMHLTDDSKLSRTVYLFRLVPHNLSAKWVPYFDDVDAIILLAPISAFDQTLVEDPEINRLADSLDLWKSVLSNPLLEKTRIVLFLNKVDILQAKLWSGIRMADYFPAYRLPNDFDSISQYAILKQASPSPRVFHCHLTNLIVSLLRRVDA